MCDALKIVSLARENTGYKSIFIGNDYFLLISQHPYEINHNKVKTLFERGLILDILDEDESAR